MNEERQRELECYFDGQLSADERDAIEQSLELDPAARTYLEQLSRLKTLGELYDPSSQARPVSPTLPPKTMRVTWSAIALIAASVVIVASWIRLANDGANGSGNPEHERPIATNRTEAEVAPVYPNEVRVYLLANGESSTTFGSTQTPHGEPPTMTARSLTPRSTPIAVDQLRFANSDPASHLAGRVALAQKRLKNQRYTHRSAKHRRRTPPRRI